MKENRFPPAAFAPKSGRMGRVLTILCAAAILAACLSGCGMLGWTARGGDMSCDIAEPFEDVSIHCVSCDVAVSVGGAETCAVEYRGSSRRACTAEVKNGVLQIEEKFAHRLSIRNLFGTRNAKLTVFLPQGQYDALELRTVSGDVELEDGGLFRGVQITTVSGDMDLAGAGGDVTLESVSGNMKLRDGSAGDLTVGTTSGDVAVTGVDVAGQAELRTVSGDVTLLDTDASSLSIRTTSGDVHTALQTAKEYVAHTTSGEVAIAANTVGAGRCEIATVSGDICCE